MSDQRPILRDDLDRSDGERPARPSPATPGPRKRRPRRCRRSRFLENHRYPGTPASTLGLPFPGSDDSADSD